MNRTLLALLTLTLLFAFGCPKKKEEVAAPLEPPVQQEADTSQQIDRETPPRVDVTDKTQKPNVFDPDKIQLDDIYFEFDKADLQPEARNSCNRYAQVLRANADINLLIEGHCDERGTEEYNLALGERRASRVYEYLLSLGIDASRMSTISYGEMRPKAGGSSEESWSKNRRAHFNLQKRQ